MSWIAYVILLLALAWILQIVGTYFQMRHYREVLGRITREGGYVVGRDPQMAAFVEANFADAALAHLD